MLYRKNRWLAAVFLLPFFVFAVVLLIYPFISNVINEFFAFKYNTDPNPIFVGFDNFVALGNNPLFWRSIGNTFILIAFVIVFQVGIALVLALFVNSLKKFANLYRILFFIPIVISATALGTMYRMFGDADSGLFNQMLKFLFGIEHKYWLNSDNYFGSLMYVMLPVIWQYIGFYFVIMLTGLTGISDDYIEAARLDGASGIKLQFYVILPMLWNVFRTCMVLAITGALKVFDMPYVIAPGGAPNGQTHFMGTYSSFLFNADAGTRGGECAVYSVLIVLIGVLVSQVSNMVLRENKDI